jgi:iron(III) transport system substrate-binding protein
MRRSWGPFVVAVLAVGAAWAGPAPAAEVNVYWDRGSYWAGQAFESFTRQTGIAVNFPVKGEKGEAFAQLRAEGPATGADVVITNNLLQLVEASRDGLLATIESKALAANVPVARRDQQLRWFGIAARPRAIVYSTERVKPSELSTYEALGEPKWKGRLCLRTSQSHYNTLLIANWIKRYGETKTEERLKRLMANEPLVLDKDGNVLKAIAAGKCDVAIATTYYLGRALANEPDFPVGVFWPDQAGAGAHVSVAGAGVAAHAKHRAEAIRLLEYLTSAEAQSAVVDANFEFPANPRVRPHPLLDRWGAFKADELGVRAADLQPAAAKLAEKVGYR